MNEWCMCVENVAAVNATTTVDGDFQNHYCYDNVSFFLLKILSIC